MKRREILQSIFLAPFLGAALKEKAKAVTVPVTKTEDLDQMVQFGHAGERLTGDSGGPWTASVSTSDIGPSWEERGLVGEKCPRCKNPATVEQRVGSVSVGEKSDHERRVSNYSQPFHFWIEYDMTCKKCGKEYRVRPEITT